MNASRARFRASNNTYQQAAREALAELRSTPATPAVRPNVTHWIVTYIDPDNFGNRELTSRVYDANLTEFLSERIGPREFTIFGRRYPNHARVLRITAA